MNRRLYVTVEPNVISEDLLRECVTEQGPQGEAGRIAKLEGIAFAEVTELRLDFKNILRIENLWQFKNLRKLQLDNNIIEDVTGLDELVQLQWLDLSFNNIEAVSGLGKLTNLKDLSLANNRLKAIANLEPLRGSLQVLSLANNFIDDLKSVEYLRPFSKLQSLTLRGNPLCEDPNYRPFVMAYVPSVIYLDYKILMDTEKEEARRQFAELLDELELQEREQARQLEAKQQEQDLQELYQCAYVNGLQGDTLFNAMFVEDQEGKKIELFPDVPELLERYKDSYVDCCEQLTKVGLAQKEKREAELAMFKQSYSKACDRNQEMSVKKIEEFEEALTKLNDQDKQVEVIKEFRHKLMWLEMQLVEQLDEIIKDFELNYGDMVGSFKESAQSHMTQLRELENNHHETVTEIGIQLLERFSKNQADDISDDLRPLLVDKDTLVNVLSSSHDLHMLAIDEKEDKMMQKAAKDMAIVLREIQTTEYSRNRKKVAEISHYIETLNKEIGYEEELVVTQGNGGNEDGDT